MLDSMVVESGSRLLLMFLTYAFYIFSTLLLLRSVITRQELSFNSIGRLIDSLTSKYTPEGFSTLYIQGMLVIVSVAYVIAGMLLLRDFSLAQAVPFIVRILNYYMIVLFISLLILANPQSASVSLLVTLFRRLGQQFSNIIAPIVPLRGRLFYVAVATFFMVIYFALIVVLLLVEVVLYGNPLNALRIADIAFSFSVAGLLSFLNFYAILLFFRVLLSWFSPDPRNNFYIVLYYSTESYLGFFRRLMPTVGMFDFSPIVALLSIYFIRSTLVLFL